jgi:hypothetical protein
MDSLFFSNPLVAQLQPMAWDSPPFTIEAHHGTNVANLPAILAEGIRAGEGDGHYHPCSET